MTCHLFFLRLFRMEDDLNFFLSPVLYKIIMKWKLRPSVAERIAYPDVLFATSVLKCLLVHFN